MNGATGAGRRHLDKNKKKIIKKKKNKKKKTKNKKKKKKDTCTTGRGATVVSQTDGRYRTKKIRLAIKGKKKPC